MKKKQIYIVLAVILFLVLFFPYNWKTHSDGTKEYSALMMKYVNWSHTSQVGQSIKQTTTFRMYFFPDNSKDYETLREEFFAKR